MSAPVLVPAFPAVLQAGLPVECLGYSLRGRAHAAQDVGDGEWMLWPNASGRYWPLTSLRLDLRDPTVRDAVVRAIWRALRPDEPEPLTAPVFVVGVGAVLMESPGRQSIAFLDRDISYAGSNHAAAQIVPALTAIRHAPDRDLLALAEVAKAVLS